MVLPLPFSVVHVIQIGRVHRNVGHQSSCADDEGQDLYRPKDLYDPEHALLKRVFKDDNRLPKGDYASPRWLTV